MTRNEPVRAHHKLPWRDASGWLPFALVSAAMLYAGLVPTLLRRRPDRLRSEIQQVIEPARRLARTRQASHAIDVSAYRAYVISHDATRSATSPWRPDTF